MRFKTFENNYNHAKMLFKEFPEKILVCLCSDFSFTFKI